MSQAIRFALNIISQKEELPSSLIPEVVQEILAGKATSSQIGALLLGLSLKGETPQEIASFAQALREVSHQIQGPPDTLDTCGTGGDNSGSFNISTTTAFVVAGAGVTVAKHGNRFSSGRCGSADVLEHLGVPLNTSPEKCANQLREIRMSFLFAQTFHPAMAKIATERRELGVRTIFNLLGPLLNPAKASYQLLGVSSHALLPRIAQALQLLGIKRAIVVVGEDGLDEVTLTSTTRAILVTEEEIQPFIIHPEEYGFSLCSLEDLQGGEPEENSQITLEVLQGKKGPPRDIVLLNAATALFAANKVPNIQEGIQLAKESLDTGQALKVLEKLRSQEVYYG
ncbi:MAG: anthranilate phosphoribosyltransferase [Desulfitobacterium sp.]|nr:anthranilate phosphoribosyltransferase [Desulfitobacterium sp.]